MASTHEGRVRIPEDRAVLPFVARLADRIVVLHTGDVPMEKTITLPNGMPRTMAPPANSIVDIPLPGIDGS